MNDYSERYDLKPAAAVLTDGDQWLLDRYYGR